jgi:hypothetical protein
MTPSGHLRLMKPERLSARDRRWLPANLRYAARAVERDNSREYGVARRLRLLADELERDS